MIKLHIAPPFPKEAAERFKDFSEIELVNDINEAEVVFGQPRPQDVETFKNLKWLQISSAGVDSYIPFKESFKGIKLTTVSGAFGQSISEWTLAMVLSLQKHLNLFCDNQLKRLWRDEGVQDSPVGKRVLILGCGDLGQSIAKLFKKFDCRITGIRRHVGDSLPLGFDEVHGLTDLDGELKRAEIIICALPGTAETKGLLSRERLSLISSEALLVNVGRGNLIDLDALYDLLEGGKIKGAALDVTYPEPLPEGHPLWNAKNCIISPHASGGSFGHLAATSEKIYEICRENLKRYIAGEKLLNEVDFDLGYRRREDRY